MWNVNNTHVVAILCIPLLTSPPSWHLFLVPPMFYIRYTFLFFSVEVLDGELEIVYCIPSTMMTGNWYRPSQKSALAWFSSILDSGGPTPKDSVSVSWPPLTEVYQGALWRRVTGELACPNIAWLNVFLCQCDPDVFPQADREETVHPSRVPDAEVKLIVQEVTRYPGCPLRTTLL